ncbi:MAG: hypothetical protein OEZ43_19555 [Gammaproteobacteria bacterium]|nr:hypothetical protein [Gammaproteobacteria bacterium]
MNKKLIIYLGMLLIVILLSSACATLNSVSLTQIPADRSNFITASAQRYIVLALNFDNKYVEFVEKRLRDKCPGGEIKGILTKDETFFFFLFQLKRVTASGYCIK